MKFTPLLASLAVALAGTSFAAGNHAHQPAHGGVVVEAQDLDFELVARPDRISLHVRDHGKAVSTQGASAKLILLTGTEKSEALLRAVGEGRLEAPGPFKLGKGSKVVVTVSLAGRQPVNLRFVLP